jgi:hypothetical protein
LQHGRLVDESLTQMVHHLGMVPRKALQ